MWLATELKVKHIHCIFIFIYVFLSALSSVKCRRGGILGGNGQRPHRLVPLRLRRRGGKRQSIRYNNAIKLYSKVSIFALFAIISLSFNQPESIYCCWSLKERPQSSGRTKVWVTSARRLEEQVCVTLMFAGGPFLDHIHTRGREIHVCPNFAAAICMQSAKAFAKQHG